MMSKQKAVAYEVVEQYKGAWFPIKFFDVDGDATRQTSSRTYAEGVLEVTVDLVEKDEAFGTFGIRPVLTDGEYGDVEDIVVVAIES
jgi:hypothetical protein